MFVHFSSSLLFPIFYRRFSGSSVQAEIKSTLVPAREQGISMGRGARARGYFSILGPGMDFYRVPMGGRNFEYMTGEDPYLGAQLVPPLIIGIQAQGVWSCAKHYVCNDEVENRTNVQILLHERTLREMYLPPFEAAVKDGHVATVMSAFNAFNRFFCSVN